MDMMKVDLSAMQDQVHGLHALRACPCSCIVCGPSDALCCAHFEIYKQMTLLWMKSMCSKREFDEWHKLDSVMGACKDCGVKQLPLCLLELDSSTSTPLVKWKCFENKVVGICKESGQEKKRIKQVFKETTLREYIMYMLPKVQNFIMHGGVDRWSMEGGVQLPTRRGWNGKPDRPIRGG